MGGDYVELVDKPHGCEAGPSPFSFLAALELPAST